MTHTRTKTLGLAFLLILAVLILAAYSSVDASALPTGLPAASQPIAPQAQTSGDSEWEAANFFATTCASCHGPTGGGSAIAPPLNGENIRTAETAWLINTISNGRTGTAMPAWSVEFGGPLNSEQITNMAAFLQEGDWEQTGEIAAAQPFSSMGSGMMGRGMGGMMGGSYANGMGYGNGMGTGSGLWTTFFGVILIGGGILLLAAFFLKRNRKPAAHNGPSAAMVILQQRYARGELSKEEFKAIRHDLER